MGKKAVEYNEIFDKTESVSFLLEEYQECFAHMRHYDQLELNFVKFALTVFIGLISISFILYEYLNEFFIQNIFISTMTISGFIFGIITLALLVRNRAYYVIVTRQVNSIRNYFMSNSELDYIKFNQCYLDPNYPINFNAFSTYTLVMYIIILVNSLFLSVGAFFFITAMSLTNDLNLKLIVTLFTGINVLFIQMYLSIFYLKDKDRKKADEAIFGK